MRPEEKLRKDWEKYVFPKIPDFCFDRVENSCSNGMPDIAYTIKNVHGWLELKVKDIKRDTTSLSLPNTSFTPNQRDWMAEHSKGGASVLLLLRTSFYDLLLNSKIALNLENYTLRTLELENCIKLPLNCIKKLNGLQINYIATYLRYGRL